MEPVDAATGSSATQAIRALLRHPELSRLGCAHPLRCAANQTVIQEGTQCGKLYLVDSGQLRILNGVLLEGARQIQPGVADVGPGELIGELAMFDGAPHAASVVTLTTAELTEIDSEILLRFMDRHPELGYPVMKALIETLIGRFRKTSRKVSSLFAWGLKAHRIDRHL